MQTNQIAVIGGGIAGLCAAAFLRRQGNDVRVYEQSPAIAPVGAAIMLAPNALQAIEPLGVLPMILDAGTRLDEILIADSALKPIQRMRPAAGKSGAAQGLALLRRSELHRALCRALGEDVLVLGKALTAHEQTEDQVRLQFADGTDATAQWVIGADGIRSVVRSRLFGEMPMRYAGQTCFRALVRYRLPQKYSRTVLELWGGAFRVGLGQSGPDEVYYWCAASSDPGSRYEPPQARAWMLNGLATFPAFVRELVEATPDEALMQTDLYDFRPIARWHDRRIGLIGDAAHATTPNMGQGGAQAIEDGYYIGRYMDGSRNRLDWEGFRARRFRKTARITQMSYRFGRLAHIERFGLLRNRLARLVPQWLTTLSSAWIYRL